MSIESNILTPGIWSLYPDIRPDQPTNRILWQRYSVRTGQFLCPLKEGIAIEGSDPKAQSPFVEYHSIAIYIIISVIFNDVILRPMKIDLFLKMIRF